jgi:hypothetical protein
MTRNAAYRLYALILILVAALIAQLICEPPFVRKLMLREHWFIETYSARGYFACAVLMLPFIVKRWYTVLVLLGLGLRELDWHKRFTSDSITKIRFYTAAESGLLERGLALFTLALLLLAAGIMVRKHAADFWRKLKLGEAWAVGVALGIILVIASKLADSMIRKLENWGLMLTANAKSISSVVEECLELGIPAILLIAVLSRLTQRRACGGLRLRDQGSSSDYGPAAD